MIDMGRVIFYDLDQDSFAKGAPVPALADEVVRKRSFDAEAAMLRTEGRLLVWFDTDNDKSWDRLVVSSMEGAPVLYSLTKTGEATEMKYEGNPYLAAATFADPAMLARLKQVAGEQLGLPEEEGEMKVPQLFVSRFAMPLDSDKNGHIDTLVAASPGSQVFLFDGEEKRFGKLTPVEAMRAYSARSVTADMAIVAHKNKAWAFYDRTGTGKFDLLLYTSDMHTGAVSDAYHLVDGKLGDPAPEHVGLRLVRPKLFASPVAAKRLATAAHVHCQPFLVADNESLGALPSVLLDGEAEADFAEVELPGFETAAVSLEGDDTMSLLLDVDRDSFKGMRTPPADVNAFVAKGQFKAEIAFVARADARWAFYDTDHDGHFDLALFVPKGANEVKQAFRIDKKGKLTADPKAVAGRLMRWSVLPKPMQANAKQLLAELFLAEQIEE
jgi:hypothetical protein